MSELAQIFTLPQQRSKIPVRKILAFYIKHRKLLTRTAYILILYSIFNAGSSVPSNKRKGSSNTKNAHSKRPSPLTLKRIRSFWIRSPTISFFKQVLTKDRKSALRIAQYLTWQLGLLGVKAAITLNIASLDGKLVSLIVGKKFKQFFKCLVIWFLIGIPASLTNSLIRKVQGMLAQSFRTGATNTIMDNYLPNSGNSSIYQLTNKMSTGPKDEISAGRPNKVSSPNQMVTVTIDQLADTVSKLPVQLIDPILDILLTANRFSKVSEYATESSLLLGLIASVSTLVLKVFTPNFAKLTSVHNVLENKFHTYHTQLINHREEIALARGHRRELDLLDTSYFELERFQRLELRKMAIYNFAMGFIFKYGLGAFGLMMCAAPIFSTAYFSGFVVDERVVSRLAADFFANKRLLLSASDSLGRLIYSKKAVQNIIEYCTSLYEFDASLKEINMLSTNCCDPDGDHLIEGPNVSYGEEITFDHVPVITPTGNILVKDLTFSIKPGQSLLVIGPNGCGKSSLFRILGGLWEVRSPGHVIVPSSRKQVFYLPQSSYFTYGTLREQILYPDSMAEYRENVEFARKRGNTVVKDDLYLMKLLKLIHLEHLLANSDSLSSDDEDEADGFQFGELAGSKNSRSSSLQDENSRLRDGNSHFPPSGLDIVAKWPDILSTGEQQRLAMARLYYHQPKFAVLDECTSAISPDLEKECYRIATKSFGITVLSVCHRTSLWKFHDYILKFQKGPQDKYATALFTRFDPEKRLRRHKELLQIKADLKKNQELVARLEFLKRTQSRPNIRRKMLYIDE